MWHTMLALGLPTLFRSDLEVGSGQSTLYSIIYRSNLWCQPGIHADWTCL